MKKLLNCDEGFLAAVFNLWAAKYAANPAAFGSVLDANGKPVTDYGKMCSSHFVTLAEEVDNSLPCLSAEVDNDQAELKVEYTPYCILLKKKPEGGFESLGIVNSDDLPEDCPEEFDLCLPIPNPETLPEFEGW